MVRLRNKSVTDIMNEVANEQLPVESNPAALPEEISAYMLKLIGINFSKECRFICDEGNMPFTQSVKFPVVRSAVAIAEDREKRGLWLYLDKNILKPQVGYYCCDSDVFSFLGIDFEQFLIFTDIKKQYYSLSQDLAANEKYSLLNELKQLCQNIFDKKLWTSVYMQSFFFGEIDHSLDAITFLKETALEYAKNSFDKKVLVAYYREALHIAKTVQGETGALVGELYQKVAMSFLLDRQYEQALDYLEAGIQIALLYSDNTPELPFTFYNTFSQCYCSLGFRDNNSNSYLLSIEYDRKKLDYCQKKFPQDISKQASCYYDIGFVYGEFLQEYETALHYFSLALDMVKQHKLKAEQWISDCRKNHTKFKKKLTQQQSIVSKNMQMPLHATTEGEQSVVLSFSAAFNTDYAVYEAAKISEKEVELTTLEKQLWGLLALSRFYSLFSIIGKATGYIVLCDLSSIIDQLVEFSVKQANFPQKAVDGFCNQLLQLIAKLNEGGFDVVVQGKLKLSHLAEELEMVRAFLDSIQEKPSTNILYAGILQAYYDDQFPEDTLGNFPNVIAETERRWSDYKFLMCHPTYEQIAARIEFYKQIRLVE